MMMLNRKALLFVVAFLPAVVHSATWLSPFVTCRNITADDATSFQVCATSEGTSPSPFGFENGTTVYLGGWTSSFSIVQGVPDGFDITEESLPEGAETNITVLVSRDDNDACTVTVTGELDCVSCTYCGGNAYSADCTNLNHGRMVECEPTSGVYYPLTADASYDTLRAVVDPTMSHGAGPVQTEPTGTSPTASQPTSGAIILDAAVFLLGSLVSLLII